MPTTFPVVTAATRKNVVTPAVKPVTFVVVVALSVVTTKVQSTPFALFSIR